MHRSVFPYLCGEILSVTLGLTMAQFPRIAALHTAAALRTRLAELGLELPVDDTALGRPASPLAEPLRLTEESVLPNRFVIQPMEGWDGTRDGRPTELTIRRWRNFGRSGAAWIWGGEAVAVRADGRANPHQLLLTDATAPDVGMLRRQLLDAAREAGHDRPFVGLQLTHSGRWSRPDPGRSVPRVAFRHPLLDVRAGVTDDSAVLTDEEVAALIHCFAHAARLARDQGFDFVDLKHCHGYLLHEFLAARARPGRYGGSSLQARTRLLRELVEGMRAAAPELPIAVRLSVFDGVPHRPSGVEPDGHLGQGVPEPHETPYLSAFGVDLAQPERIDLREAIDLARSLVGLGITWLNVTAGSPYYVPHLQRPAAFPPSDGYAPPEDPLYGVARLLSAAREVKRAVPALIVVSSGWTYLQEYVPHVAQACVRAGWFDAVGIGRLVLSYPELPADVLAGRRLDRRRLCRTFSDCTTAPRNGFVSGCYPLDPFYRTRPEHAQLNAMKRGGDQVRN
jgi:2,4-dienoyl-CoA reductase-like NADH-dependent reductase (Old Yellow Enzyme family)